LEIGFYNAQDALAVSKDFLFLVTKNLLRFKQIRTDEVIFHFVDKIAISHLHQKFFGDSSPTDCISFPMDHPDEDGRGYHILGEVFVCPQMAVEYAKEHGILPYEELCVYIIHGFLHLLGYEDQDPVSKKIMRIEEKRCIDYLKQRNVLVYEHFAS